MSAGDNDPADLIEESGRWSWARKHAKEQPPQSHSLQGSAGMTMSTLTLEKPAKADWLILERLVLRVQVFKLKGASPNSAWDQVTRPRHMHDANGAWHGRASGTWDAGTPSKSAGDHRCLYVRGRKKQDNGTGVKFWTTRGCPRTW